MLVFLSEIPVGDADGTITGTIHFGEMLTLTLEAFAAIVEGDDALLATLREPDRTAAVTSGVTLLTDKIVTHAIQEMAELN